MIELFSCKPHEVTLVLNFMLFVADLLQVLLVNLFEFSLLEFKSHVVLNELAQTILNMKVIDNSQ